MRWVSVASNVPLTTSGVIRLKGNKQCGARACITPFALDPVSNSVRSRSWCASQKRLSSDSTKGEPPSPRGGSRVSCAARDVPTPRAWTTAMLWSDGLSEDPTRATVSSSIVRGGRGASPKVAQLSCTFSITTRRSWYRKRREMFAASNDAKVSHDPRPTPADRSAREIHIAPGPVSARGVSWSRVIRRVGSQAHGSGKAPVKISFCVASEVPSARRRHQARSYLTRVRTTC